MSEGKRRCGVVGIEEKWMEEVEGKLQNGVACVSHATCLQGTPSWPELLGRVEGDGGGDGAVDDGSSCAAAAAVV